jgi:hypothetical protein
MGNQWSTPDGDTGSAETPFVEVTEADMGFMPIVHRITTSSRSDRTS